FVNPILSSPPKSYEAYRLMTTASSVWMQDLAEAERLTRRALAKDSTYQSARAFLSLTLLNEEKYREGDSVLRIVEADQSQLSPGERAGVEWQRGALQGDNETRYRSAKQMTETDPSMVSLWILAFETSRLNRPRESVALHERIDPMNAQMDHNPSYYVTLADAQHMLGEHERELTSARSAQSHYPTFVSTMALEAVALAALRRTAQATRLLDRSVDLASQPGYSPGRLGRVVTLELLAHGDSVGSARAGAWTVRWYETLPRLQQRALGREYAEALYALGRWSDAERALDDACPRGGKNAGCLGLAGAIAARLGKRATAQQISAQLSALPFFPPSEEGRALEQQAYIAAALGDNEAAVRFLRLAVGKGMVYSSEWHRQPDLQLLRNYAPFVELLRPKG
ncbi:MAG: hypothetical protein ABIT38_20130, partial [Gemmatimonadaceae bacterium]